jgi:hypothetical protein
VIARPGTGTAILVAVTAALLTCGGLLAYGAGRGADLTDEIFYLVWTRDPDAYRLIYQPFGYLLHPLFALAGGDLRRFRLFGFAIAAGAGALLGKSLSRDTRGGVAFTLYGALAGLTIFFPWIVTPSYNSAANVGAMLVISGVLAGPRRIGPVLAAAGLCIAAFSKPPLFLIAVVVMAIVAGVARSRRAAIAWIVTLALATAMMSLLLSPKLWPGLVARMAASQHVLALPNTPLSLPIKVVRDWWLVPLPLTGAAIAAAIAAALRGLCRAAWARWLGYAAVVLSLYYVGSILPDALDGEIPDFLGLAVLLMAAGYAGVPETATGTRPLATALLLGAPVAVALGTFNNQWAQLNFSMVFPFMALFALAWRDPVHWRRGVAWLVAILGPTASMLLAAFHPYSLPASVFDQQIAIRHPITHSPVLVDPETAAFVESAQGRARNATVIDLSGTGPGVVAALGGRAPVLLWLNPATATWPDVAWSGLSDEQRSAAWFVGPVWPLFSRSAPARWLAAHRSRYCGEAMPEMSFWDQERTLLIWRPCRASAR